MVPDEAIQVTNNAGNGSVGLSLRVVDILVEYCATGNPLHLDLPVVFIKFYGPISGNYEELFVWGLSIRGW